MSSCNLFESTTANTGLSVITGESGTLLWWIPQRITTVSSLADANLISIPSQSANPIESCGVSSYSRSFGQSNKVNSSTCNPGSSDPRTYCVSFIKRFTWLSVRFLTLLSIISASQYSKGLYYKIIMKLINYNTLQQ